MSKDQMQNEIRYQLSKELLTRMLFRNLITEEEYNRMNSLNLQTFQPAEAKLYEKIVDVSLKSRYPLLEKGGINMNDTAKTTDINEEPMMKNVCAYCRVSTNIPHQKGSYESQLEYYENMIRSKADWNFVGIYADYGKSGTKEKGRTDFMRMLEDCEAGEIDIICTKSISRFARNTVECIQVVRKLKEMHIDVYFEKERIHTLPEKSELLLSIYSSVAQAESESISSNQKWSIQKDF